MKTIKLAFSASVVLASVMLTGCLKERTPIMDTGNGNTTNVIEFLNTGDNMAAQSSTYPKYYTDLGSMSLGQSGKININVSYSGVDAAPADMTLNLAIDAASLTLFNTQNGSSYVVPPTDVVSFPATLTIKKGERTAQGQITVKLTSNYDFNKTYALPLKIVSTSPTATISSNFGAAMYAFGVRNSYDGEYTVTGTMVDYANSSLTGVFPMTYHLLTATATTVIGYDPVYWGSYFIPIYSGSSISGYGSFAPIFTIDPATNKITSVVNYYGQPASNTRSAEIDPSGVNTYDPATKTIKVKFFMKQPSVVAAPPNIRVAFDWTMKFVKAR